MHGNPDFSVYMVKPQSLAYKIRSYQCSSINSTVQLCNIYHGVDWY